MSDKEKMAEEERDKKIIDFFREIFKTHDSDKTGISHPQPHMMPWLYLPGLH